MECRSNCGACCIAPSINSPLPGMPNGKAAGVMCVNLDSQSMRCQVWGQDNYPDLCRRFTPTPAVCGASRDEAIELISLLESATGPD